MKHIKKIFFTLSPLFTFILLFGIIELAVRTFNIAPYVLPSPLDSFEYIFTSFSEMKIHVFKTFKAFIVGYPIGSIIGILLALIFSISKLVNKAISPYLTVLYCTPMLMLVPLLKIWLGYAAAVATIVCALSCFSSTMTQTMTGAASIPHERIELMQSLKGTKLQQFLLIVIPSVLPSIFTGLRLGAITGLAGVIGAEMIGDTRGIGFIIRLSSNVYKMKEMFAYVYLLMLFGYVIYDLINFLEKKIVKIES